MEESNLKGHFSQKELEALQIIIKSAKQIEGCRQWFYNDCDNLLDRINYQLKEKEIMEKKLLIICFKKMFESEDEAKQITNLAKMICSKTEYEPLVIAGKINLDEYNGEKIIIE